MTVFNTFEELDDYCADPANSLEDVKLGSSITSLASLFAKSDRTEEQFKGIEKWDVSRVTDFSCMFFRAENFNSDISGWDVGQAVNMRDMFCGAYIFNKPLERWNVSSVTDMQGMFKGAKRFNQPLESWDVSHVSDMSFMFCDAEKFNQPLENWDVSGVSDFEFMFFDALCYNQPLNDWKIEENEYIFPNSAMVPENYPWVEIKRTAEAEELKDEPESEGFKVYRNYENKLKNLFRCCF